MKIFGVDFDRIDYKSFDILNFLNGCSKATLSKVTKGDRATLEIIKARETICNSCPLGKAGTSQCYRDLSKKEIDSITKEMQAELHYLKAEGYDKFTREVTKATNKEIQKRLAAGKYLSVPHAKTGKPTLGCGCIRKCKQADFASSCPAKLWEAIVPVEQKMAIHK